MKLRAQITVELESKDFVDAARHQQRFEEFFQNLQREYGNAELQFRERRVTAGSGRGARPQIRRPTGYVNRYEGE